MGTWLGGGYPCLANNPVGDEEYCASSDAMSLYLKEDEDGNEYIDAQCFSCQQTFRHNRIANSELGEELEIEPIEHSGRNKVKIKEKAKEKRPLITDEAIDYIQENCSDEHNMFRGIEDEWHNHYGIQSEYNDNGKMIARHYPVTKDDVPASYRNRVLPKDFSKGYLGYNGADCDLFGWGRFNTTGKYLLIVGGEEDCPAALKMLTENQRARGNGNLPMIPVMSSTVGEGSTVKQIQANYDKLEGYEVIVVCMDNDKVGKEAAQKICEYLPPDKDVRIMECPIKDPCEALREGKRDLFVSAFYNAPTYMSKGVVGSGEIYEKMLEELEQDRLPLPPFLRSVEDKMAGGPPLKRIVNIGAASGVGKSTIANELIYYWVFNSPYKLRVLSIELDHGEYCNVLLSRHMGVKINNIKSKEDRIQIATSEKALKAKDELLYKDGDHRFLLLDEGDGGIEEAQSRILNLIVKHGCQVVVIDPLSDLLDGLTNDQQAVFMRWQKQIVKRYNVLLINILHIRKGDGSQEAGSAGRMPREEDFQGSSAVYKSAAANLLMARNKYAEDPIERNTTKIVMSKCRWSGETGTCESLYYDNQTSTLWEATEFFGGNPPKSEEDRQNEEDN